MIPILGRGGRRGRSARGGFVGPFPYYSSRTRRGSRVTLTGCCLPIPLTRGDEDTAHVNVPDISDGRISGPRDYPAVGAVVEARVLGYSGAQRQLRLTVGFR